MHSFWSRSLFVKILGIFAVAIIVTFALIESIGYKDLQRTYKRQLMSEASIVTELLAMQLGGSVKFGNVAAIGEILDSAATSAEGDWVGAVVFATDGTAIFQTPEFDGIGFADVVQDVVEGQPTRLDDRELVSISPVLFGGSDAVIGVLVTQWSATQILNDGLAEWRNSIAISAMVFLGMLIAAGITLRSWISVPLVQLEGAVTAVAAQDFHSNVPHTNRGDEIGEIARRLESFRANLKAGAQLATDSAYKSAAFEGSSAAMMVVNNDMEIVYCNPCCLMLLRNLGDDLLDIWDNANLDDIFGSSLKGLQSIQEQLARIDADGQNAFPMSTSIAIGGRQLRLKFNAALDICGEFKGAVLEWSDRTMSTRNTSLVEGIDTALLRAEFSASGTLNFANKNFCKVMGLGQKDVGTNVFARIFRPEGSVVDTPLVQQSSTGRFCFSNAKNDELRVTDGGFVAVKGVSNKVENSLFVGMDVTALECENQRNEARKKVAISEQIQVVTALGLALKSLAEGRLDCEIHDTFAPSYEELRGDFNSAISSLRETVRSVLRNAATIRSETTEITTAADDLSRRTELQASTLEETAAALDQLTSSVRSAADGAQGASEKASAAQTSAQKSGDVAREAVTAMDQIKSSSREISKITSVIDDIAFQTNLLALNAGVEAARAGEAGRGFAVVATEVRALAQRSSDAAREINELISSSEQQVRTGVDLVDRTGTALSAIVGSISEISELVSDIATSTKEQSSGLNEVNSAVLELDQVTQQNAAMFEETTAASHALTAETDSLAHVVAKFRLGERTEDGLASGTTAEPEAPTDAHRHTGGSRSMAAGAAARQLEYDVEIDDEGWEEF